MDGKKWKFSRSHDQTYVDCPYKAFLEYYWGGKGIVRSGFDVYKATGSLTHEMLHAVMEIAKTGKIPNEEELERIAAKAKEEYRKSIEEKGFDEFSGNLQLEMERQMALAEGLVWVWTLQRLPLIMEEYKIVATEEEHEIDFGDGLTLMSRLDGVLERKADGEYFAGPEFKTTGWMSSDYLEQWRYATQILSHSLDIEAKYGKKSAGVLMEFLYKGFKKKDTEGVYTYYSPLVRAYRMKGEFGEVEYGFDSSLARKRDWEVFEPYVQGMGNWIPKIPQEEIDKMLFSTIIYRDDRELERWKAQVKVRQGRIRDAVGIVNGDLLSRGMADIVMNETFPARLDHFCFSNMYHKRCEYLDVCFNRVDDPVGSGLFIPREPHHANEFEEDGE